MGCWAFSSYRLSLISASLKGCHGGALGYSNPLNGSLLLQYAEGVW